MDPWAPINGLSLERYAELGAAIEGVTDPEKQAEVVGQHGVPRLDWEAAKAGWTQRMADPALMGQVAKRYGALYQGALARRHGQPQQAYPQQQPQPQQQQPQQPYPQQPYPQSAGAQIGSALNAFGNAFGALVESAVGGFSVGSRVLVQWSDGKRYPGTVTASQGGQVEVAFPDGRRVWVAQAYVSFGGI